MVIIVTIKVLRRILPLAQLPVALVRAGHIAWVLSACLMGIAQNVDHLTQQAQVLSGYVPLTTRPTLIRHIRPAVIPIRLLRAVRPANGGTVPETLACPALQVTRLTRPVVIHMLHIQHVLPVNGGIVRPALAKRLQLRIAPLVIIGTAVLV